MRRKLFTLAAGVPAVLWFAASPEASRFRCGGPMTEIRLDNLRDFMSGYYHQDYLDDFPDDAALVRAFASQNPLPFVKSVTQELRDLLAAVPPEEITDDFLFARLECYGGPAQGTSNAEWLAFLLDRLDQVLRQSTDTRAGRR